MKTKPFFCAACAALLLFSCNKEELTSNKISSGNVSEYATNGVLTAQVSIRPPVTPQTFIVNKPGGNQSVIAFDVSSTKKVIIDYFQIAASYPQIYAVGMVPNRNGVTPSPVIAGLNAGQSSTIPVTLTYNNVDASNSPSVDYVRLNRVDYHVLAAGTDQYNNLPVDSASGTAFSMCQVNNVAHLAFKNPSAYGVNASGYTEIARVQLTGDTSWTLNSLPLHFYYGDFGSKGKNPDKLVVKYNNNQIATASVNGDTTIIKFPNGFQHVANKVETLKIFGRNLNFNPPGHFYTEIGNLNGLVWKDGLGGLITGTLNAIYFKDDTGTSDLANL